MSSSFITDFSQDPFADRLVIVVYGRQKLGKTSLLLRMVEKWADKPTKEGPIVYLISADRGTKAVHLDPEKYKGRLAITYPYDLRDYRTLLVELKNRVDRLVKKRETKNIWVVVDTTTHMQIQLLSEARKIEVSDKNAKVKRGSGDSDYQRDALTRVDYNVNLGHMAEISNSLLRLPANIVFIALEKTATVNNREISIPALSGQSKEKILGDADVVARMTLNPEDSDSRVFEIRPGVGWDAGDRTGRLDGVEPADLQALYDKIMTRPRKQLEAKK